MARRKPTLAWRLDPQPNASVSEYIARLPAVTRQIYDGLLQELRVRAITITGIGATHIIERVRDLLAEIPAGADWEETKRKIIAELQPFLGKKAPARAEILLRHNVFLAQQALHWRLYMADPSITHFQYISLDDDRVRPHHRALNGIILPKEDPFWETHFPPWEWGCRCRVRGLGWDEVQEIAHSETHLPPDQRLVLSDTQIEQLRQGTLIRNGQTFYVGIRSGKPIWDPELLFADLAPVLTSAPEFARWAENTTIGGHKLSWLLDVRATFLVPDLHSQRRVSPRSPFWQAYKNLVKKGVPENIAAQVVRLAQIIGRCPTTATFKEAINTGGYYQPSTQSIHLNLYHDPRLYGAPTIAHEFAHFVHYNGLAGFTLQEIEEAWRLDKQAFIQEAKSRGVYPIFEQLAKGVYYADFHKKHEELANTLFGRIDERTLLIVGDLVYAWDAFTGGASMPERREYFQAPAFPPRTQAEPFAIAFSGVLLRSRIITSFLPNLSELIRNKLGLTHI